MRVFGQLVLVGVLAETTMAAGQGPDSSAEAARVLAAARQALGGEARLSGIRNFVATGRTRQIRGDNLVPIEFEIVCELPDKYVRKDEIPAQESGPTSVGFNGDELIQQPAPSSPAAGREGAPGGGPAPAQLEAMRNARVSTVKQDFVRLTLGMFAGSFSSYPVTFAYVAQAEAPQGKADVIDARGGAGFTARLFVSSQTHLPIMVSWQAPSAPMRGMPPGRGAPPGGAAAGASASPGGPPTAPVEYRIYFADYREVDGIQLPFRLRKATGADTTEETTFDRFRLNTKIDQKKFEVRK